jgi:hypothetical protein
MNFLSKFSAQDIANARETKPLFPIGAIEARIIGAKTDFAKSGQEMLIVTFGDASGAEIKDYITDNQYALQKLRGLMTAFTIPYELVDEPHKWLGNQGIVVTVENEPYNGKVYPKVSHYRSIKDGNKSAANPPTPPRPPAEPATVRNDDIPF